MRAYERRVVCRNNREYRLTPRIKLRTVAGGKNRDTLPVSIVTNDVGIYEDGPVEEIRGHFRSVLAGRRGDCEDRAYSPMFNVGNEAFPSVAESVRMMQSDLRDAWVAAHIDDAQSLTREMADPALEKREIGLIFVTQRREITVFPDDDDLEEFLKTFDVLLLVDQEKRRQTLVVLVLKK